jgi:hypothetical protein
MYNTTFFLMGGWHTSRRTGAEPKRIEVDFVQSHWPDAEGPDGEVSRYTRCDE